MRHAKECVTQSVALRPGHDFHAQIALGDSHGDPSHFFQIGDHVVKSCGERANFVVAMDVDVLVEVAGIADFTRNSD
jgi:hypothetical protein